MEDKELCILTHWGRVTQICVSDLTSIGSDNCLSPVRRQAIIRTNAGILLTRPLGTDFIQENVFESVVCEKAAILSRPQWVKLANNMMTSDGLATQGAQVSAMVLTAFPWNIPDSASQGF